MTNSKIGVLIVNLGTPKSPHPKDVKHYLNEFLTDGRVIDKPWLQRQLLVRGLIVPSRYKQSANSYQDIWTEAGSPLLNYSLQVNALLQNSLGADFQVELAMRYQFPSLQQSVDSLLLKEVSHLIVLPLFPQYASATTGSIHQKVMELLSKKTVIPKLTFIHSYPDNKKMIEAFCSCKPAEKWEEYDHILFSFHGLPQNQLLPNSPFCYSKQCYITAEAMIRKLGIPSDRYKICFQSRLGKQPWIQPYTSDCIRECAEAGHKRILVFCPSFVSDCLETIFEIGVEYSEEFKKMGGESLDLVEGLNTQPYWIEALKDLVLENVPHNTAT